MKRCLTIAVWSLGLLLSVNGVCAANAYVLDFDMRLALERFELPYGFGGEGHGGGLIIIEEEEVIPDSLEAHMDVLRSRLTALGGAQLSHYLGVRDTRRVYPMQLALELVERRYPNAALLTEAQQIILGEVYAEVSEIMRLISLDESLILESERSHVVDVFGLLLRASGCSLKLREWSFRMLMQYFLLEKEGYKVKCYLDIWARALSSGYFPCKYIHQLRCILLDFAKDNTVREVQMVASRTLGALLGNVALEEHYQAEILRCLLDLSQSSDERGVQAVVQGMQLALRGELLTEGISRLIFDALLLCPNSSRFPQFQYHAMGSLIDRALLDTWAEGLRAGWFDQDELIQLVPVIMDYHLVRNCPIRTRGVVAALIGLLHARAEDSTFRQLVFQHIGEILFAERQREVVIAGGVEQLSELFVNVELPEWERTKIIAYLVALFPGVEEGSMSGGFADALVAMLGCEALSVWERNSILLLMSRLCVNFGVDLELRRGDVIRAVDLFREQIDYISDQEEAFLQAIVESLPEDDDDLDLEDDDLD